MVTARKKIKNYKWVRGKWDIGKCARAHTQRESIQQAKTIGDMQLIRKCRSYATRKRVKTKR